MQNFVKSCPVIEIIVLGKKWYIFLVPKFV